MSARPPLRLEWSRWARSALPYLLPPLIAALIASAVWEAWVEINDVSKFVLPPPSAVAGALFSDLDFFAREGLRTFGVAAGGLAIGSGAAVLLAIAMAHSATLERALLPIAIAVKVTPIVALAPLFIIWFGFGWQPKVAIAALITYFPVLINGIVGFRDVDPGASEHGRELLAAAADVARALAERHLGVGQQRRARAVHRLATNEHVAREDQRARPFHARREPALHEQQVEALATLPAHAGGWSGHRQKHIALAGRAPPRSGRRSVGRREQIGTSAESRRTRPTPPGTQAARRRRRSAPARTS